MITLTEEGVFEEPSEDTVEALRRIQVMKRGLILAGAVHDGRHLNRDEQKELTDAFEQVIADWCSLSLAERR